jgi:hypothetical protein
MLVAINKVANYIIGAPGIITFMIQCPFLRKPMQKGIKNGWCSS